GWMHRDRTNDTTKVRMQIRGSYRRENRTVAFRGEHGAPLKVPRIRNANRRSFGVRVCRRPGAPRVVRRFSIARSREELDLTPWRNAAMPAQRPPGGDGLCVARLRFVRAAIGAVG